MHLVTLTPNPASLSKLTPEEIKLRNFLLSNIVYDLINAYNGGLEVLQ